MVQMVKEGKLNIPVDSIVPRFSGVKGLGFGRLDSGLGWAQGLTFLGAIWG